MNHTNRRIQHRQPQGATTIKQVAQHAGVSTATVSRVLADRPSVSEELRDRVLESVRALDYEPNRIARYLRVQTTRTIGVVLPDIQNTFFTSILRGIEDGVQQNDYTIIFSNSGDNIEREHKNLRALLAERVAGIIFVPISNDPADYLQMMKGKNSTPFIALDRAPEDMEIDTIAVKNTEGVNAAISHLISLGHRRIGMVCGPLEISTAFERLQGYYEALDQAGIPVIDTLIQVGDYQKGSGYDAMEAFLALPEPPTAVFTANNLMTLGALKAIREHHLTIPSDMAIIGFDDPEWADIYQPPLTVVAQPTYQLGLLAARQLLARIHEPNLPICRIALDTQLMVRSSCGSGMRQFEYGRSH